MISADYTKFKYLDRGYKNSIALIPGWASDYRIFNALDLKFNYLIPVKFSPFDFNQILFKELKKNNFQKIKLFGWSMGGFLAIEFSLQNKELVDEAILLSIRKKYPEKQIKYVHLQLKADKSRYLHKFYLQSFNNHNHIQWFENNLMDDYCQNFNLDYLLRSLNYLKKSSIDSNQLKAINKLTIIHGETDQIAPIEEVKAISNNLENVNFISLKNTGHVPFLTEEFKNIYDK